MIKFGQYLSEEKNTHMTHIEDQVIYGGVKGARDAILALRSLRDMLAGNSNTGTDVTVKWDGAPAVFCGQDPSDGKFFVAKKGIFNKNPKVYKTNADIDADISSADLNSKMKIALEELAKLGIKGVVQGDIMFTSPDLKTEKIDGVSYTTFHPNTIVYAVPNTSDEAKRIRSARIGVVFHTTYSGKDFESMSASYGADVSKFRKVRTVWAQDAELRDLSGTVTLTKADTAEVTKALSDAGRIFNKISSTTLKQIESNSELSSTIETYNNSMVRNKTIVTNTTKHTEGLIKFIADKYQKEIDKRSTPAGKTTQIKKRDEMLLFFSQENKQNLKLLFDLQQAIVVAKLKIINKLNRLNNISTFVKTTSGFKVTGAEGFVAIDRLKGGAVKLVDRMEFSTNNFSKDIIKGWDTPSRS
jgi:hypothetical protein|tara:strand:+ start:4646 stop:5887 length:1242 start_codon:yes stop_codon:yes gene_type:complete